MWPYPLNNSKSLNDAVSLSSSSNQSFFSKDGREIHVGDCALFKPPRDSPPFIGIIKRLTFENDKILSLEVNWLYRPADVKLAKGILLEAAPNEVFYSFHKDEILAASLLHPCKIAFLRKGVQLPPGFSAFVCRRVYDIENKRLWWLTDKDYTNERQEEVVQLLDKTRIEMNGVVQSGGRSPRPSNGSTSAPHLKGDPDSLQNNTFSQAKGKRKELGPDHPDPVRGDQLSKMDDVGSLLKADDIFKSEIDKITDRGRLLDFEGVEKLVRLMQPDGADKKIDLAGRIMLVDVIAVTDRPDFLNRFVQLQGLLVLDEWLQEVHRGKIGGGTNPKGGDKSLEDFVLALLRALDKLPVDLHALKTCKIGKSVNHLRTHKNHEIQKKARTLVDLWKKGVEAEMHMNEVKLGVGHGVTLPTKPASPEVSHAGNRRSGGSGEVIIKSAVTQAVASRTPQFKPGSGDSAVKTSPCTAPGSLKSSTPTAMNVFKESNHRMPGGLGTSNLVLKPVKEEKSSSSSQSQSNSLSSSSDHVKTMSSSQREERSSTAVSVNMKKTSGRTTWHRKSLDGPHGSSVLGVKKEKGFSSSMNRNLTPENPLSPRALCEKSPAVPLDDNGNNQRLIVRLPSSACSPGQGFVGGVFEDPAGATGRPSPDANDKANNDEKVNTLSNVKKNVCHDKDGSVGFGEADIPAVGDEQCSIGENGGKLRDEGENSVSSSVAARGSIKSHKASLSSINALVESCAKLSEAIESGLPLDDVGMNLLASVAAGEITNSGTLSLAVSPERNSPIRDEARLVGCSQPGHGSEEAVELVDSQGALSGSEKKLCTESQHVEGFLSSTDDGKPDERKDIAHEFVSSVQAASEGCQETDLYLPSKPRREDLQVATSHNSNAEPTAASPLMEVNMDACSGDKLVNNCTAKVVLDVVASTKVESDFDADEPCSHDGEERASAKSRNVLEEHRQFQQLEIGSGSPERKHVSSVSRCGEIETDLELVKAEDVRTACNFEHIDTRANYSSSAEKSKEQEEVGFSRTSSPPTISKEVQAPEIKPLEKPIQCKLDRMDVDADAPVASTLASAGLSASGKVDFDLNVGFPVDDEWQGDLVKPSGASPTVHSPCALPFLVSSASTSLLSVLPPENPLHNKVELGWKGSAATSAFRPAEPRKNPDMQPSSNDTADQQSKSKHGRTPFDFDLNVPDERVLNDFGFQCSAPKSLSESGNCDRGSGVITFDLNKVEESMESGVASNGVRSEVPPFLTGPPLPSKSSKTVVNVLRNFDLNGPVVEEVGTETLQHSQVPKTNMPCPPHVPNAKINTAEFSNLSAWFPSGNATISFPPVLCGRGEANHVATSGSQRILAAPPGSTSFVPDVHRGLVLASSPAVPFSASTPFQHPGFPFETTFPLSSNSYTGSIPYLETLNSGQLCFPTLPTQLVGSAVVCSTYPRPCLMSHPSGAGSVLPENGKLGSHVLDLNAGPGGSDVERRDDRWSSALRQLSSSGLQSVADEHLKLYHGAGGLLKRKEPDSGWDATDKLGNTISSQGKLSRTAAGR